MVKYYAKQVNPEWQEDNLFYTYKDKNTGRYKLGWNDDVYEENVVIYGNNDYHYSLTKEFECLLKLDSVWYEYEPFTYSKTNNCYWSSVSEFVNWYFPKSNGKKYTTHEIHEWKKLLADWNNGIGFEDYVIVGLKLMTGKNWRKRNIVGCMQREWQNCFISEEITDGDMDYIEMCYFNTGTEWLFYESKEDMDDDSPSTSYYVDSYNYKQRLCEHIGCKEEELVCFEFDGYKKIPQYKQA